ncbi:MAG: membrane protein insertase YidC [Elusimicrobia bacterium]|nr:membrane protein insertase YidC [Elusimicrobiota bacterium]
MAYLVMEKRTFLAIILSLVILFGWQWFFGPKSRRPVTTPAVTDTREVSPAISPRQKNLAPAIPSQKSVAKFQIETDNVIYVLSMDEASIVNCFLKEERLKEKTTVELVLNGKLLNDKNTGIWSNILTKNQSYQATFVRSAGDFDIEKTFYFSNGSYLVDIKYTISNKTKSPQSFEGLTLSVGPGLGTDVKELKENIRLLRVISYSQKKVEKLKPGDYQFPLKWAGIDNRYFLSVFLRTNDDFKNIKVEKAEKLPLMEISTGKIDFLPSEKKSFSTIAYIGPKGYTHLKGIKVDPVRSGTSCYDTSNRVDGLKPNLEKAVDFGFFGDLGELALSALNYIYKFTHNYGWAIFIISVILNIIFYPLSKKSFTSAQKMKSVQEDVKALQVKYKSDHKKMNSETWALYKAKGVNPFSGCLPMLVQLPIFWALFTMLRNAYELRGAPFIFWITDLSAKDPYYILPILMGGGMFLQQWMSTNTADPTQKQMMIMMPIIFTVMFLGFPSGLVIYWLTNSIITVLEQWLVFKKVKA